MRLFGINLFRNGDERLDDARERFEVEMALARKPMDYATLFHDGWDPKEAKELAEFWANATKDMEVA